MEAIVARVSARYQVVIPRRVREALDLQPCDDLLFVIEGNQVVLRPRPESFTDTLRGLHSALWPDPDAWLEHERSSWGDS